MSSMTHCDSYLWRIVAGTCLSLTLSKKLPLTFGVVILKASVTCPMMFSGIFQDLWCAVLIFDLYWQVRECVEKFRLTSVLVFLYLRVFRDFHMFSFIFTSNPRAGAFVFCKISERSFFLKYFQASLRETVSICSQSSFGDFEAF